MGEKLPFKARKEIDWDVADRLIECGNSGTAVAAHFGIHPDTLHDRCLIEKGVSYTSYSTEKKQKGICRLLAKQYEVAMKGNTTMLIWVGKQMAGQRDFKEEQNQQQKVVLEVNYKNDSNNPVEILPSNISDSNTTSPQ